MDSEDRVHVSKCQDISRIRVYAGNDTGGVNAYLTLDQARELRDQLSSLVDDIRQNHLTTTETVVESDMPHESTKQLLAATRQYPSSSPYYRTVKKLAARLRDEFNYSPGLAARIVMSINLSVSDPNLVDEAVEILFASIEMAQWIALDIGGTVDAVEAATRNMSFKF